MRSEAVDQSALQNGIPLEARPLPQGNRRPSRGHTPSPSSPIRTRWRKSLEPGPYSRRSEISNVAEHWGIFSVNSPASRELRALYRRRLAPKARSAPRDPWRPVACHCCRISVLYWLTTSFVAFALGDDLDRLRPWRSVASEVLAKGGEVRALFRPRMRQ